MAKAGQYDRSNVPGGNVCPPARKEIHEARKIDAAHPLDADEAQFKAQAAGPRFGMVVCLAGMCVAAYIAYLGQPLWALAAVILEVGVLAAVFAIGKRAQRTDLAQKKDAIESRRGPA